MPHIHEVKGFIHERDERWSAVDNYAWSHLFADNTAQLQALEAALKHQHESGLPDIAVSPLQGAFLAQQCRFQNSKRVLEVGTLGGYSTIWFTASKPDIHVTTVDVNPAHTEVAKRNVDRAGFSKRVDFIIASGLDALSKLRSEYNAGERQAFDFVFIDADKINGLRYLQLSLDMVTSGACIIVDNVVRRGRVANEDYAETDENVRGSRQVIEGAAKDPRVECTLMQTVGEKNYDGMLICRVK